MTEFDLWGPWTGAAISPNRRRTYLKHRSWFWPVFVVLALIAIVTGSLVALSGVSV